MEGGERIETKKLPAEDKAVYANASRAVPHAVCLNPTRAKSILTSQAKSVQLLTTADAPAYPALPEY